MSSFRCIAPGKKCVSISSAYVGLRTVNSNCICFWVEETFFNTNFIMKKEGTISLKCHKSLEL